MYHAHSEFIILSNKKIVKKNVLFTFSYGDGFCCFKSKKALIAYCQCEKTDWIDIIRGPKHMWNMKEEFYYEILNKIHEGKYVIYAKIYRCYRDYRIKMFKDAMQIYHQCDIFKEKKGMM